MTNSPVTLGKDGKLTLTIIKQILKVFEPYLKANDGLTIVCSKDVCSDPKTITGAKWKMLFNTNTVDGVQLDYLYGILTGLSHEVAVITSRTLPAKTCSAVIHSHEVPTKPYKYYPYSAVIDQHCEQLKAPPDKLAFPVVPGVFE